MRLFFAKEKAGEMPKGTALRWAHETKNRKKLPEHVKKAFWDSFEKTAARKQRAHGRPHYIPKDPFKQIQRRMVRKSRMYYT